MRKRKTIIQLLLFAIGFFLLGYFRNTVFLNINERASLLYYKSNYPPLPGFLSMFENYNYEKLLRLKWILTVSFTILYAIATAFTLKVFFTELSYSYIGLGFYLFVFLISLFFIGLGKLIPAFYVHGFNISRSLSHFEQSPVIALLLTLAIYTYKKPQ